MKTVSMFILFSAVWFLSCKKCEMNQTDTSNQIIKAGFVCGWGAGTDSLEISKSEVKYAYYIPSKASQAQIRKSRAVSNSEWLEIQAAINLDQFSKLQYNTCNVCADGCDEWISIQNDKLTHEIRYDKDLKIEAISKLQLKLSQLRAEFNTSK